jgi:hypothetical protein
MDNVLPFAVGIHTHDTRKLGKAPKRNDPRTMKLSRFMDLSALPPAPVSCNRTSSITNLGSMLNDDIGDCTFASGGHMVQAWTAEVGKQYIIPDAEIEAAYAAVTGYTPNDPNSDTGAVEIDVLNYWRQTGIGGHKIGAYASISPLGSNFAEYLKQSINLLGGAYAGFSLPTYAQDADIWMPPTMMQRVRGLATAGSWGGHAVPFVAYDASWFYIISWGTIMKVHPAFVTAYCDEVYGIVSVDQLNENGLTPAGFDNTGMNNQLHLIAA